MTRSIYSIGHFGSYVPRVKNRKKEKKRIIVYSMGFQKDGTPIKRYKDLYRAKEDKIRFRTSLTFH